eukprot:7605355-Alexandrium_andersonii.AAC.1
MENTRAAWQAECVGARDTFRTQFRQTKDFGGRFQKLEHGLAQLARAVQGSVKQSGPPSGGSAFADAPAPGWAPNPSFAGN